MMGGPEVKDLMTGVGVGRRSLLTWAVRMTALLALPASSAPRIVRAVQEVRKPRLIWLEFQDCTGDTESFLRARNPGVSELVLKMLSLDYHETLMTASGDRAESCLDQVIAEGGHLVLVEGSVPLDSDGAYCVVGGKSARQRLQEAIRGAAGVINVGTCSAYGGLPAARPNPTGAVAVGDVISGPPVVNLPGCPVNADTLTATVVHYLTFGTMPATDADGRPLFAYGQRIHDTCPRRGHFEAGRFALAFGDAGHRAGWCLYKLGCKGPSTFHNCPIQKWNGGTSWPIGVGAPCTGCSQPGFWDTLTPVYERLPHATGAGMDLSADAIGLGLLGATVAGVTVHGAAKVITQKRYFKAERAEADIPAAVAAIVAEATARPADPTTAARPAGSRKDPSEGIAAPDPDGEPEPKEGP
jgi:hydrogenase small subunit